MPRLGHLLAGLGAGTELDPSIEVTGLAPFDSAGPGQLTFAGEARLASLLGACRASAILVTRDFAGEDPRLIRVADPKLVFLSFAPLFAPPEPRGLGVHPSAVVEFDAELAEGVTVDPLAYVGHGARIGRNTWVCPHVYIGPGVVVGEGCIIRSGARIERFCTIGDRCIIHGGVIIGSDGFGFTAGKAGLEKEQQLGYVQIGNDVEIGANSTIDRAMIPGVATTVGDGTKIDNLGQIGHNCRIGRSCVIVGQVGISGSVTIGDGVQIGGQTGIRDHVCVGDGVRLAGRAGVTSDVPDGSTFSGFPAQDHRAEMRLQASLRKVPALRDQIAELSRRVDELERQKEPG